VGMNIEIAKKCFENNVAPNFHSIKNFDNKIVQDELILRKKMLDEWKWAFNGNMLYRPTHKDL
jgi:hypothetical protein